MTIYYIHYRLREDLPGHWRRQGPFGDRPSAEDFARVLGWEMPGLDEVKVVAEDTGMRARRRRGPPLPCRSPPLAPPRR